MLINCLVGIGFTVYIVEMVVSPVFGSISLTFLELTISGPERHPLCQFSPGFASEKSVVILSICELRVEDKEANDCCCQAPKDVSV